MRQLQVVARALACQFAVFVMGIKLLDFNSRCTVDAVIRALVNKMNMCNYTQCAIIGSVAEVEAVFAIQWDRATTNVKLWVEVRPELVVCGTEM